MLASHARARTQHAEARQKRQPTSRHAAAQMSPVLYMYSVQMLSRYADVDTVAHMYTCACTRVPVPRVRSSFVCIYMYMHVQLGSREQGKA